MRFNVIHYLTFHTMVRDIEADSPEDAIRKSSDGAWERGHTALNEFDFSEEQTAALVDVVGDEDYINSCYFSREMIEAIEEKGDA
jgi:hypothetical protein